MTDNISIARKKTTRGVLIKLLYDNQSAALTAQTMEYALMQDNPYISSEIGAQLYYLCEKGYVTLWDGDERMALNHNPPRSALVRLIGRGIDLMEGTIEDGGVIFGDAGRI